LLFFPLTFVVSLSDSYLSPSLSQFKPREFADQINLNMDNAWGILYSIVDTCMKLDQGKYLLLKDPNKPTLLLYDIPDNTFDGDEEDEDDDDESDRQEGEDAANGNA
jgi:translation initiation factor 3 subunit D